MEVALQAVAPMEAELQAVALTAARRLQQTVLMVEQAVQVAAHMQVERVLQVVFLILMISNFDDYAQSYFAGGSYGGAAGGGSYGGGAAAAGGSYLLYNVPNSFEKLIFWKMWIFRWLRGRFRRCGQLWRLWRR